MSEQNGQNGAKPQVTPEGITKITVGGYKSIAQEQSIEIRPLTILAGANSSGKSSIMQPLLLLKQTLESSYDPGALLLNGPNIKFTSSDQCLSQISDMERTRSFCVGLNTSSNVNFTTNFVKKTTQGFEIKSMVVKGSSKEFVLTPDTSHDQIAAYMTEEENDLLSQLEVFEFVVFPRRCFLELGLKMKMSGQSLGISFSTFYTLFPSYQRQVEPLFSSPVDQYIREVIYLPGLRGEPIRNYPVTSVSSTFTGPFDDYTASLIGSWQYDDDHEMLADLEKNLTRLGLTNHVIAEPINDAQVEIRVGRTLQSDAEDMVSIADVGIGVSQTLPVLVALLAAKPGQLVYLEQPEIHLHPRAQTAMAQVLADAAMRGVRVVAETHSSLLLLGVQTLVAEGKLPPELVKLHWFERGDDGTTTIRSADLDEGGAFGDWPEDFGDVSLDAQDRFLDAAEKHLLGT